MTEEKRWEHRLWTRRGQGTMAGAVARSPLLLLAGLYGLGVQARIAAYRLGLLPRLRPAAKAIVVGNLTVGGVGKTPLAAWIARRLLEAGRRPAVLTRGYRGRAGAGPLLVSGGDGPLVTVAEAGDEAVLLAHRLRGVPVIAGSDRGRSAEFARREFQATDLVLDDGYQHLALERDLDLLLVEAESDLDREYLLPRGPLREPLAAAGRAHALILTGADEPDPPRSPWMDRYCPAAPLFAMRYRTLGMVGLDGGIRPLRAPSFAFCGLGRPEGFFSSLAAAGVPVAGKEIFEDHHGYTESELRRLAAAARQAGAERLVTTEKDAMKIERDWTGFDIAALRVEPDFFGREDEFFEFIVRRLGREGNAA